MKATTRKKLEEVKARLSPTPSTIYARTVDPKETHYKPREIAAWWGVSAKTVCRVFKEVPEVLVIDSDGRQTLRIPHSVMVRVYQGRLTNPPGEVRV